MSSDTIAFIGAGNLASSLIGGIIQNGHDADRIIAADPSDDTRRRVRDDFGIRLADNNADAVSQADIVVLAVKPQVMADACQEIADSIDAERQLVISVAAGISAAAITKWLAKDVPVVRIMPNTPALIGRAACGMYATDAVNATQREKAKSLAEAVGLVCEVDSEDKMHAVTAVSGSGPAYFFLTIETLASAGRDLGLDADTAERLAVQTAVGAAHMCQDTDDSPGTLREKVTSPNGTTQAALESLTDAGFQELFQRAVRAAAERSASLSTELEQQ